jgi:hypothetical protein
MFVKARENAQGPDDDRVRLDSGGGRDRRVLDMGQDIGSMVNKINTTLTAGAGPSRATGLPI